VLQLKIGVLLHVVREWLRMLVLVVALLGMCLYWRLLCYNLLRVRPRVRFIVVVIISVLFF
jgi:hypothetical protein